MWTNMVHCADYQLHSQQLNLFSLQLRAVWYTIEVMAQANKDIGSGYVCVVRDTHSSPANFDRKVFERMLYYEMNAWPVKLIAAHVCCPPSIILRIVKPILFALTDKKTRTRTKLHDVAEDEIPEVLSTYGIMKNMLPIELGGATEFKLKEWIETRRAEELEEIQ